MEEDAGAVWDSGVPAADVPAAAEYLKGRGVSDELLSQLDCRYLRYRGERVFFPLYRGRQVKGLHGRLITGIWAKGLGLTPSSSPDPKDKTGQYTKDTSVLLGAVVPKGLGTWHPEQGPPSPHTPNAGERGDSPSSGSSAPHEFRPRALARPSLTPRLPLNTKPAPVSAAAGPKYCTVGADGVWLPRSMHRPEALFVCEGIFDALFFWPNGVAVCGLRESVHDIRTLLSLRPGRIILVGDNDKACDLDARAALWRRQDRSLAPEKLLPPPGYKDFGEVMEGRNSQDRL